MSPQRRTCTWTVLATALFSCAGLTGAMAADPVAVPVPLFVPAPLAEATSLPAVSAFNGKLDISGGWFQPGLPSNFPNSFDPAFRVKGAISMPVTHSTGVQFDGAIGNINSRIYGHAAAHAFWRDPAVALVGGYASWTGWNSFNSYRAGVEGEYYAGRATLSGVVGYEWGDVANGVFTIEDLSFYANDDLKLSVGHRYSRQIGHSLALGGEYQFASTPNIGYAAYVDGRLGDNDYKSIYAGLKLYFGPSKSLIRRHREDDPDFHDEPGGVASCVGAPVMAPYEEYQEVKYPPYYYPVSCGSYYGEYVPTD